MQNKLNYKNWYADIEFIIEMSKIFMYFKKLYIIYKYIIRIRIFLEDQKIIRVIN